MATRTPQPASSFYSYSAKRSLRQEEIAAYRRIALATVIIVVLLVGGYFIGVPLIARLGAGSDAITTHTPLGTSDNIPPTAPRLDGLPDITKNRTLTISGSAESGATVKVLVNDKEQLSTLSDKSGLFNGTISLSSGENTITATATDGVGNQSRASKAVTITYDATAPKLLITNPIGDTSTSTTNSITVTGTTEAAATISINDRQAIVQPDGSFSLTLTLTAGQNTITITATDSAGNSRKDSRTVTYQPAVTPTPKQATASATSH